MTDFAQIQRMIDATVERRIKEFKDSLVLVVEHNYGDHYVSFKLKSIPFETRRDEEVITEDVLFLTNIIPK